jgi:hypothetical protein
MLQSNDQAALTFVTSGASHVRNQVYSIKYPDIVYPTLVPIATDIAPWAKSVTYFSEDGTGKADWLNGRSGDFPMVDVSQGKFEQEIHMAGIGYDWTLEEVNQAMMMPAGFQALPTRKAFKARRKYEEMMEAIAITGDTAKNLKGLINNANVTAADVANGAQTSPQWSLKTPDEILLDVNTVLTGIYTGSLTVELADTLLLPSAQFLDISTRRLNDLSQVTILAWLKQNNAYTAKTGQPLDIRELRQLDGAGSGNTDRMVAYRKAPDVLELYLPVPLTFLPPKDDGWKFTVRGYFRTGGVDVKLPKAMRYADAI